MGRDDDDSNERSYPKPRVPDHVAAATADALIGPPVDSHVSRAFATPATPTFEELILSLDEGESIEIVRRKDWIEMHAEFSSPTGHRMIASQACGREYMSAHGSKLLVFAMQRALQKLRGR